jgi:hypothetical protein
MKAYWTDKQPNGKPITYKFARVIDLEDGTHPQWVYGETMDEVLEKIERNHANAQRALLNARREPAATTPTAPVLPAAPARLTADEKMRLTLDLQNPAKAATAMVKLIADETGVDPAAERQRLYANTAVEWEREHPEFYQHPGNRRILGREAINRAGGNPAAVTKQVLTQCFNELLADGQLFEGQNESTYNNEPHSTIPAETQVRTERPKLRSIGGIPAQRLRAAQTVPTRTLKYSEAEYFAMPLAKRRELLANSDPDYLAAANKYEVEERAS